MKLTGKHITLSHRVNGIVQSTYEVFHFHRGRQHDPISVGFIEIPLIDYDSSKHNIEFQKRYGPLYELAPISSNLMDKFTKNWDLVLELPDFVPD